MRREKEVKKKKGRTKRIVLIILIAVLSLVLAALILGVAYVESMMGLMGDATKSTMSSAEIQEYLNTQPVETVDATFTGPTLNAEDIEWGEHTDLIEQSENVVNILLIGQDRRPGEGRARSDSMILCTLNKTTKSVTMTSFMRDTYVQIPGYSSNRINASYAWGGMELLDKTLERNFGVQVDGNVEVDFNGFISIVDLLGGVEIYLTADEARYLNYSNNWNRNGEYEDEPDVHEGVNLLSGPRALAYARTRYVGNGDFGRTERQRNLLTAIADKAKSLSLFEFNRLLKAALPLVTTDMSNAEIIGLALEVFPMLSELKINTQRIPVDGAYQMTMIDGMSVLLPNLEKNRAALQESMKEITEQP